MRPVLLSPVTVFAFSLLTHLNLLAHGVEGQKVIQQQPAQQQQQQQGGSDESAKSLGATVASQKSKSCVSDLCVY